MEWICFIKKEKVKKAEELLKKDFDVAAKESITVRDAKTLGIKKEGSFFLIRGTDHGVKYIENMLKDFVDEVDEKDLKKAREEIKKEEDAAAEGFGGIFG